MGLSSRLRNHGAAQAYRLAFQRLLWASMILALACFPARGQISLQRDSLPALLSETGVFNDLRTLSPNAALIGYDVNVPFWSDGADKSRWIAVPDGTSIRFAATGEWEFPAGTVFVKHFELPTEPRRRLETRLLVRDAAGSIYGAAYKWRSDNSDADLIRSPLTESIAIGEKSRPWYYPGPEDCQRCHVPSAGSVLGVHTRQLNHDYVSPDGTTRNQLRAWSDRRLFDIELDDAEIPRLPKFARLDDASRTLEERARSYLDANCAYCHRPGGVVADFDARFSTPLARQNLIDAPVRINLGIDRARFIAPNDPWRSMILLRVETAGPNKMPPLGHQSIDNAAVELLRTWIRSLPGPPVVPPPEIAPNSGDFTSAVQVVLKHGDPSAVIRYTLDGSAPRESSPVYAAPLQVTESTTVRARAFKPGHTRSIAVHETFIIGD